MAPHLKLAWDRNRQAVDLAGCRVAFAPAHLSPFEAEVWVEEQDTWLSWNRRSPPGSHNELIRRLLDRMDPDCPYPAGEVLSTGGRPLRLSAIVHDIDQEPSCRIEWIGRALATIIGLCRSQRFTRLALPPLGTQRGGVPMTEFLELLERQLEERDMTGRLRIWLVTDHPPPQELAEGA
ncbi:MAG: hypothetical protein D6786_07525 [Gammaproteobacteria bacterium]|nr:MAG: hypothetical protein D6786_07525 [Gammaproteobacteria bacterium]